MKMSYNLEYYIKCVERDFPRTGVAKRLGCWRCYKYVILTLEDHKLLAKINFSFRTSVPFYCVPLDYVTNCCENPWWMYFPYPDKTKKVQREYEKFKYKISSLSSIIDNKKFVLNKLFDIKIKKRRYYPNLTNKGW